MMFLFLLKIVLTYVFVNSIYCWEFGTANRPYSYSEYKNTRVD